LSIIKDESREQFIDIPKNSTEEWDNLVRSIIRKLYTFFTKKQSPRKLGPIASDLTQLKPEIEIFDTVESKDSYRHIM